jgi:hypothetical protein
MNKRPTSYLAEVGRNLLFASIDEPTVDATRAAYILGFADWGASKGRRSWMLHGIALRSELHFESLNLYPLHKVSGISLGSSQGRNSCTARQSFTCATYQR